MVMQCPAGQAFGFHQLKPPIAAAQQAGWEVRGCEATVASMICASCHATADRRNLTGTKPVSALAHAVSTPGQQLSASLTSITRSCDWPDRGGEIGCALAFIVNYLVADATDRMKILSWPRLLSPLQPNPIWNFSSLTAPTCPARCLAKDHVTVRVSDCWPLDARYESLHEYINNFLDCGDAGSLSLIHI